MQSVEMIPFGLLAGFVDDKEVRITEISTESFCFRVREQVERPRHIRIGFYDLSESMYREVELESYYFMEKRQEQWYVSYTVEVFQQDMYRQYRNFSGNTPDIFGHGSRERTERWHRSPATIL